MDQRYPGLSPDQILTLEAFADTVIPGRRRSEDDVAISGVHDTPGAVEAGALDVLTDPAAGLSDGIGEMADLLHERVTELIPAEQVPSPSVVDGREVPVFVRLTYEQRRLVVAALTESSYPEREIWFLVALFAYMAYDSAPHLDTAKAVRDGHPGLLQLGFDQPGDDGLWRNDKPGYGRPTARPRPGTDERGNLP
ncbi:DUF5987 family protein [Kineosporia succinea]|uniref:Gluconate 2-dehydrogenase subunit 3 family protein n=1 Tax=Kineosporia succinea TaxID=84632 RepID=A0ABT9PAE7_9ACTN|nr:DUF5987 family protein [Kineosporia succinea]MDP9829672.1 hypothetical protein [Kineosporia succinea]